VRTETKHVIITGSTGFVGRHFLYGLLVDNPDVTATLLVRDESIERAEKRLRIVMEQVTRDYGNHTEPENLLKRCRVVLGDLTKPRCGVPEDPKNLLTIPTSCAFWHFAASLNFETTRKTQIDAHNIDGTRAAIDLAIALHCHRFVYVSTAYTCGKATGEVPERLHPLENNFGNAYEQSKCTAEHVVQKQCRAQKLDFRILRPSIVVGLSTSGIPSGTDAGLYGFTRELLRLKRPLRQYEGTFRIVGDGTTPLNVIPVNLLTERMLRLDKENFPRGPIYHLTASASPTVQEVTDVITDAIGIPRIQYVNELPSNATPLERLVERRIVFYSNYLKHPKHFQFTSGSPIAISSGNVRKFINGYLESRNADKPKLIESVLTTKDGFPLQIVRNGRRTDLRRPIVVFVNALGMPHGTLTKIMTILSPNFDVISWESRGVPSLAGRLDQASASFSRHIDDLEEILAHDSIEHIHLVGWCTGADVALAFHARHPKRVLSLSFLNGSFARLTKSLLPYQTHLKNLTRRISKSPTQAGLFHSLLADPHSTSREVDALRDESSTSVTATLAIRDDDLLALTSAPLQSPELLHRYCVLMERYFEEAPTDIMTSEVPTLFCTAEFDTIAPTTASIELAKRFFNSRVFVAKDDGHFAPCTNHAVASEVHGFLTQIALTRPASQTFFESLVET
jgi:nucleoside-diphosphate-sugar epimerase/pimeloyl-ACP methyl ester carboxylesterase